MSVEITRAKKEDIPGIMNVFNELSVSNNKSGKDSYKRGFLVYPPDKDDLGNVVKNNSDVVLVAKDGNKVVGYALAYDMRDWKEKNPNWGSQLNIENEDQSLYFKHIGRLQGYKKLGLQMEQKAEQIAKEKEYKKIFADISKENQLSQEVHEKRGYEKIAEEKKNDGTEWGIYQKNLDALKIGDQYEEKSSSDSYEKE
ncbi:MAG: N-acetyltransferase family protein [Candidatus Pacearchaeota archaeon]